MHWLSDTIDKAVQFRTRGDFFKHRRDGYKAIHVIRRSNQHGHFLEVSEFHSGSRQSVIRIPAGEERKGWVNFSLMCKGFWEATRTAQGPTHNDAQDSRMGAAGKSNSRWASKGKEPQSKLQFENSANLGVNAALGIMTKDTNGNHACLANPVSNSVCPLVNARVGLTINMELVCGPGGRWEVAWTKVAHSKVINSTAQTHNQARDPSTSKQVWRPKATPPVDRVNPQPGPSSSSDTKPMDRASQPESSNAHESSLDPSQSFLERPLTLSPIVSASAPEARVPDDLSITDDWALQLRDGRRVALHSSGPVAPLTSNPFFALSPEFTDCAKLPPPVLSKSSFLDQADDDAESSSPLALEFQQGDQLQSIPSWEDEAEWVEPLAISVPMEEGYAEQQLEVAIETSQNPPGIPSAWVSTMMKEVGECLGASYEGFEDKVMELLCTIEASSGLRSNGEVWQKSNLGPKNRVPREVRNLISSVNYEGGSSKRTTSTSGRAMSLSK